MISEKYGNSSPGGGRLAVARIITGGVGIAFLATILLGIDHAVVAAYGIGSTVFAIFFMLLSGFSLTAIRGAKEGGLRNSLLLSGSAAILASVVCWLICVLFGIIWNFYSIRPDLLLYFNAYFWLRILTLPLNAMTSGFSGALVSLGQESQIFRNALIDSGLILVVGLIVFVFFRNNPLGAIHTIVVSRVAIDTFFFFRYYYCLRRLEEINLLLFFRQAFLLLWTQTGTVSRWAISALAGTGDIVVLLGAFWFIQVLSLPLTLNLLPIPLLASR